MKILIIHNRYQSKHIGGEDVVFENELVSLQKELGTENVFSYEVSNDHINKFQLFFSIWFSFKHYKKIKEIVTKNSIDLVHVHNFYPLLTPSIFKASKITGAKVVHTLHNYRLWCISGIFYRDSHGICEVCTNSKFSLQGIFSKCFRNSLLQSLLAQLSFWFYKANRVFENIDYFFVLTEFQKNKVISLGIDIQKVILKPNSIASIKDTQKDKSGYIFVGRLEEAKGIVELLKLWRDLPEKFVLTIIGTSGKIEEFKKKYSASNIIFKGTCTREETLKHISTAKYLMQPSLMYETFGLTIVEAMGHGVPVIGLKIGTRPDFIENEMNGFLCDIDRLKETIAKSYNYSLYDELSKNAILKSKEFENKLVIKKQIDIYNKILGK